LPGPLRWSPNRRFEKLAAAEQRSAVTMLPLEAPRAWMLLFIDHVAAKGSSFP